MNPKKLEESLPEAPSNLEMKRLLDQTVTRLENWRLEVERNPNPRMVHVLKNLISHIDALTRITGQKTNYSYKQLSRQMAVLIEKVARLNIVITDSLSDDDRIDRQEEERVNACLRAMIQASFDLMGVVQQAFIIHSRLRLEPKDPAGKG